MKQLEKGEASVVDLKKNLEYAASVLEFLYAEETRQGTTFLSTHTHTYTGRETRQSPVVLHSCDQQAESARPPSTSVAQQALQLRAPLEA